MASYTWEWSIGELPREIGKRLQFIGDETWRGSCGELAEWVSQTLPVTEIKIGESLLSEEEKGKWYRKG